MRDLGCRLLVCRRRDRIQALFNAKGIALGEAIGRRERPYKALAFDATGLGHPSSTGTFDAAMAAVIAAVTARLQRT